MSDQVLTDASALAVAEPHGLSQIERVVDTFIAPRKTFTDILRNTSWWLPFVLMVLFSTASTYMVDRQVGFDRVAENQVHQSPKAEEALNQLSPEQRVKQLKARAVGTRYVAYGAPVLLLVFFAFYSLVVWAAFNFGLGASTRFGQVFAVSWYAALPYLLISVLGMITLAAGGNAEAYDMRNPVGTNLAYYLPDLAPSLKALLGAIDVIKLWSTGLMIMGMAIVARKTIAQSAVVIGIFWIIGIFFALAGAAFGG